MRSNALCVTALSCSSCRYANVNCSVFVCFGKSSILNSREDRVETVNLHLSSTVYMYVALLNKYQTIEK